MCFSLKAPFKHKKITKMNIGTTYLLGLITGRGHIFTSSKTVAIEFSHANEFAEGIAHCQKCGYLAT